jgi:hypothetical protein
VPNLSLSFHPPYFTWAGVSLHYGSMLTDPYDFGVPFPGHSIKGVIPLDGGPETVAAAIYGAIAKVDLAKMVAAGTIERIFAEYPRHPVPWTSFYLAQCAVYLQKYEDARDLLENALKYADQKGRQYYGTLASEAEVCLSKLDSNPRFLRQELVEMMDYNWSHFKVVS